MKYLIWNRHTKRVLKHVGGWLCIVGGLIMLITPGQGILTLLVGIYLLADEIPFFGRIRDWIHRKFPRASEFTHRHIEQLKARFHRHHS